MKKILTVLFCVGFLAGCATVPLKLNKLKDITVPSGSVFAVQITKAFGVEIDQEKFEEFKSNLNEYLVKYGYGVGNSRLILKIVIKEWSEKIRGIIGNQFKYAANIELYRDGELVAFGAQNVHFGAGSLKSSERVVGKLAFTGKAYAEYSREAFAALIVQSLQDLFSIS